MSQRCGKCLNVSMIGEPLVVTWFAGLEVYLCFECLGLPKTDTAKRILRFLEEFPSSQDYSVKTEIESK